MPVPARCSAIGSRPASDLQRRTAEREFLLDLDDQPVTEVAPGTILLPVLFQVEAGLEVGDAVTITAAEGFVTDLTIAAFETAYRDAGQIAIQRTIAAADISSLITDSDATMPTTTAGSVRFAGQELGTLRQKELARLRLTTMGCIFQHVHLLKNLSLLDNVVLPARPPQEG